MQLADTSVRHAKPKNKSYKMADSQGLYIQIMPSGSKHWKMKYRFEGREKKLSFGEYPLVSLRDARDLRDAARIQIIKGIDPSYEKAGIGSAGMSPPGTASPISVANIATSDGAMATRHGHHRRRRGANIF